MKLNEGFVAIIAVVICIILVLTHYVNNSHTNGGESRNIDTDTFNSLMNLIKVQNETIHTLENHLKQRIQESHLKSTAEEIKLIEISDTLSRLSMESEKHQLEAARCRNLSLEM